MPKLGDIKIESLSRDNDSLKKEIEEFEEASGVKITSWGGEKIGEAVNIVLAGGIERRIKYAGGIRSLAEKITQLADELDALQKGYDEDNPHA